MITKDQNKALLIVANSALKNPDWAGYANYCFAREKGLRTEAFTHLATFLKFAENWPVENKREFVKFLFPFFETIEDADYGPFPQPLSEKLIRPTLAEWCKTENNAGEPFRWYGKYYGNEEHLFRALEINPADDLAREAVLSRWAYNLYFSVHHLPDGYIGEPDEDMKLMDKTKEQIQKLTRPDLREKWTKSLEEEMELIKNYMAWKQSGHTDFEKWGVENNKLTSYRSVRTYNYEQGQS